MALMEIAGSRDLTLLERVLRHPEYKHNPEAMEGLADKLWGIFKGTEPPPPGQDHWSERARMIAGRTLPVLSDHNLKLLALRARLEQPATPQELHHHQHLHIEAVERLMERVGSDPEYAAWKNAQAIAAAGGEPNNGAGGLPLAPGNGQPATPDS